MVKNNNLNQVLVFNQNAPIRNKGKQNLKKQETYLNYADAKEYVSKLNLKTHNEWVLFSKTDRPKNIPANPWKYYKEWNGIKEFLN